MAKHLKWFLILGCAGLGLAYFQAQRLLLLTDLSTLAVNPLSNPDYQPQSSDPNRQHRQPVYLISYAAGGEVYFQNQHALAQSALGKGIDFVLNYRRSLIDPKFIEKNREIMDTKAGAGLWLWKPWIILHTLETVPENAVIIYADAGFTIHGNLRPLIQGLHKKPIIVSEYNHGFNHVTISENISRSMAQRLLPDIDQHRQRKPMPAGFLVIKNCPETRKFIKTWLNHCRDKTLMHYQKSNIPEHPEFKSTQSDQSIFNALAIKHPNLFNVIDYNDELIAKYVYWTHRRPPALDIRTSLVPYYGYMKMNKLDKAFFNLWPLRRLRDWIYR